MNVVSLKPGIRGNDSDIYNFDVTLFYIAYKDRIGSILQ
jgi:hypothetical protein